MDVNFLRFYLAAVLLLTVVGVGAAFGEECPKIDSPCAWTCDKVHVPLSQLLMSPPAEESKETLAELMELQDLEALRTPEQAEHARGDHKRTVERFLGEIGIKVDQRAMDAINFFKCIADATEEAVHQAKLKFNRVRPYKLPNNGLHTLKEERDTDTASYPSGHAAFGMVTGLLLVEILPEKRQEIVKRIEDYGYSRMLSGVHFRSDVYAGQIAGGAIVASFFKDKEFLVKFDNAKEDLRKVLGYP